MSLMRSFARRIGKKLSNTKKSLLANCLPKCTPDIKNPLPSRNQYSSIILEIGFGMGEHFIHQASNQPEKFFLGIEPYLNGVANILAWKQNLSLKNIKIWPDDADLLIKHLPSNSFDIIYILFPDPWPKKKQIKRRFLNLQRLSILSNILKPQGKIYFVSDDKSYARQVECLIDKIETLSNITQDSCLLKEQHYIKTRYHLKSLDKGINPEFLTIVKNDSKFKTNF